MSQQITNAFENYWQSCLTTEQPVVLDEFILADIPNLDITSPIDPDTSLPPESQIVHRQNVDQRGRINNNAVAYTIVMDTTVGDFSFNAMYLRNKQNGVIGMIVYKGRETKLKTDQTTGQTGNSLVKSMLMGYDQAAEATLTHVDAGTWQIDYAARLRGMDEDIRQLQADLYGHHTFIGDGFKVVEKDGAYQVTQGVAIIGGLRVELIVPQVVHPGTKPIGVWVDVHRAGSLLSEHQNHFTIITSVADLPDHVDGNGYQHYVAKLGTVQADGSIEDGRGNTGDTSIPDALSRLEEVDGMLDLKVWEALRRTYAEVGLLLEKGSFENGTTLNSLKSVALHKGSGKAYSGIGPFPQKVEAGTDPDSAGFMDQSGEFLAKKLKETGGAGMVFTASGESVQEVIDDLKESASDIKKRTVFGEVAPSLPALTAKNKALFKPTSVTDCLTWIVSRKAQGKRGWVAVAIDNSVSQSDSQNYGGASNYRPTYVINGASFFVAKTAFSSKTSGTVLSSLTAAQVNTVWGYIPDGAEYTAVVGSPATSWASRQVYDCAAIGDSITYQIESGDCTVRLGMTNGSTPSAKIKISFNGTDFVDYQTVALKHPPSGNVVKMDVKVVIGATSPYYVRVENAGAGYCLVAGVNIGLLPETGNVDIDSAMFVQVLSVGSVPNQYQGGGGANEFAAKEAATGKFFGTYHGGHGDFLQRLRTEWASYQIETQSIPEILITKSVQFHSYSKLTIGETVYQYTAESMFGDGAHVTTYAIRLIAGSPISCERIYTHMCTTQRDFEWVHLPLTFKKTDDGDINVGQCQFIQQFRGYDAAQLNSYFSAVNIADNSSGGAYVSFQPNYNKQYYGPALNSEGTYLYGGQFVTAKEYL